MPRVTANEAGLDPHFKVRVFLPGAQLHLASQDRPQLRRDAAGRLVHLDADWIGDDRYGDTIEHLDVSYVIAVSSRWSP